MLQGVAIPAQTLAPERHESGHHSFHRGHILSGWAEIPGLRMRLTFMPQLLGQTQIAVQRLEHMLPGANRPGIAYPDRTLARSSPHKIRNQPIGSPISSTDHIPGPRGGHCDAHSGQKRVSISRGDELGASFAAAVRIVTAHGVVLAIAQYPFTVFVTLVTRDIQQYPHSR